MIQRRVAVLFLALLVALQVGAAGSALAWATVDSAAAEPSFGHASWPSLTPSPTYTPRPNPPNPHDEARIGIRLLEAPVIRRDDPRAQSSIVDHVAPGTTIHRRIEVSNITSEATRRIEVYPGAATIKDHRFVVSSGREPNELASWISVDRPVLDMPPNTTAVVVVTIAVPKDASKGERYAAVWAWTTSGSGGTHKDGIKDPGDVGLASGVGIPVFLDVGPGGEPRSDFRIENLRPGRTTEGAPQLRARVRNTGGRALVMSGKVRLSNGPGGLEAGPYDARVGTTLLPGDVAPVVVGLDDQLPDGPWKIRLTLRSGRVVHTVQATLTFPEKRGVWGLPVALGSPVPMAMTVAGGLGAVAAAFLVVVGVRKFRTRDGSGAE